MGADNFTGRSLDLDISADLYGDKCVISFIYNIWTTKKINIQADWLGNIQKIQDYLFEIVWIVTKYVST